MKHGIGTNFWQPPEILTQLRAWRWDMVRLDYQDNITKAVEAVEQARSFGFDVLLLVKNPSDITALREQLEPPLRISGPNEPDIGGAGYLKPWQYSAWLDRAVPRALEAGFSLWAPVISNLNTRGLTYLRNLWPTFIKYPSVNVDIHRYAPSQDAQAPQEGSHSREDEIAKLKAIIGSRPWGVSEWGYASPPNTEVRQAELWRQELDFWESLADGPEYVIPYQLPRSVADTYGVLTSEGRWLQAARVLVPDPPVVVPPSEATFAVVTTDHSVGIPDVTVLTSQGQNGTTNADGYVSFQVRVEPISFSAHHPQYADYVSAPIVLTGNLQVDAPMIRTGPAALTRVQADGFYLKNAQGRWFGKLCSDFLLYQRYLDGQDITPLLDERARLGANGLRVFGMVASFRHWYPQDYGQRYYDSLPDFCDRLAARGLYLYFTVFADTRIVMPSPADQQQHWDRVLEQLLLRENTIVELGNELDQHDNAVDAVIGCPTGILACCGSLGGQPGNPHPLRTPDWTLGDFHARRDYPKTIVDTPVIQIRLGDTADGLAHPIPIWHGEPQGFGLDSRRWQDPERARELAGTAIGTAAGICFHSDNGVMSESFDTVTQACARAFFDILRSV